MTWVVALLAAVVALVAGGCGDDGAEPGASREATLVLDFAPNAVHAPLYLARERGLFERGGVDVEIRAPGASTDAPKLLSASRTDFAILDIQDLAIARERGLDLVAVAPLVNEPLAAVLSSVPPRALADARIGVTGLPSDDAVLDTVLRGAGVDPAAPERVTIGFQSVAALAAGRVDAATAFRNAEAVELRRRGVRLRVLGVERFGAPPYPELVLVTRGETAREDPGLVEGVTAALAEAADAVRADPEAGLDALLAASPGLDRAAQRAQLEVVRDALGGSFDRDALERWARWAAERGIVEDPPDVDATFR
jgi:NitT/TauT family transport system substrate-binding protein/putative hydroxymethylpyrimidine transport system substrate-binding protein